VQLKNRIHLKSPDEVKRIREAGRVISEIFRGLQGISFIGLTTLELDSFIENAIYRKKARSSFKTVANYDFASCISINDEVVHGIPSRKKIIRKGDIVKVDIGVVKKGYFADACCTFMVEPVTSSARKLVEVSRLSLDRAIDVMHVGRRLGDIGSAIQSYVEEKGFSIVRDLFGHGVGFSVHELPRVPHFGVTNVGLLLREGMVLAVEPIVNEGNGEIVTLDDGWTIVTADGRLSAQFEHTVAITDRGPVILTE
jgi:methionyl aminopeptidase